MSQTPNSSANAYVTAAQFLQCYSKSIAADMLKFNPNSPPPSYLAILDPNNPAGQRLLFHLKEGAGEIEAACGIAKRYDPLDLNALTGVSQVLLMKLNAARAMWSLNMFLRPLTARPEDVPMARESAEFLQELRDGEMIFGFFETQDAGLPAVQPPNPGMLVTPNVIKRAQRLFPSYGINGLRGGGGN